MSISGCILNRLTNQDNIYVTNYLYTYTQYFQDIMRIDR